MLPVCGLGFLWLSVIREHKWVTVAAVGCPSWPGGAVCPTRQHSTSRALETPARPFVLVCDWSRSHECPPSAGCPSQLPCSLGHCPSRPGPLYCAPSNFPCSFCSNLHCPSISKHTLGLWPWQHTLTTLSSALTPPSGHFSNSTSTGYDIMSGYPGQRDSLDVTPTRAYTLPVSFPLTGFCAPGSVVLCVSQQRAP